MNCPLCKKETNERTRWLDSEWCKSCVEKTLEEQDELADAKAKPQIFRI